MARGHLLWGLVALVGLVSLGCSTRSPILMYRGTEGSGSTTIIPIFGKEVPTPKDIAVPLKAGIRVAASPNQKLTDVHTWLFPFYFLSAGFPKRDESEFLRDTIMRDLFDTHTFRYTYQAPFDPATVDLIVDVTPTDFEMSNDSSYSTLVNLPYVNTILLFGVPQEKFKARMKLTFDVKTRDGAVIKSYKVAAEGTHGATIYEMPFANYIWTKSVFREVFIKCMDDFRSQLVADAGMLQQRVGQAPK